MGSRAVDINFIILPWVPWVSVDGNEAITEGEQSKISGFLLCKYTVDIHGITNGIYRPIQKGRINTNQTICPLLTIGRGTLVPCQQEDRNW